MIRPIKPKTTAIFFSIVAILSLAVTAQADIMVAPTFDPSNQAAPPDTTDYEGIFYDFSSTFPPSTIAIGTFNFAIPTSDIVIGATISGTFGDTNGDPTTALADLSVLDGTIPVGGCDDFTDPCFLGTDDGSLVPWSHTFNTTELGELAADFAAGSIDFTAVQNSFGQVVVGTPTLDIQVEQTPEPASIFTFAGGLLAFVALRRRK